MHWIQKHILRQLSVHASCRYSELRPEGVDGNLFMYHVQQLQKAKLVTKDARAYVLAPQGKAYVSRMSLAQGTARLQPKIVVMVIGQNQAGEHLLFRWNRQPYFSQVSFPFSKIHIGRPIAELLQECLRYKANLRADFSYIGDAYIRSQGSVAEHILAHLYSATNLQGELWADGLTGQPFWSQLQNLPTESLVPGCQQIAELVASGERGFLKEITT